MTLLPTYSTYDTPTPIVNEDRLIEHPAIGDVVVGKQGGYLMTVTKIVDPTDRGRVFCEWFDRESNHHVRWNHPRDLLPVTMV